MFCFRLENAEYCIFNKPVTKEKFEMFSRQYKRLFSEVDLRLCKSWPQRELLRIDLPEKSLHRGRYYTLESMDALRWAKTLPGYDQMILYNITMLPVIIND
jgi:hypothetical protein